MPLVGVSDQQEFMQEIEISPYEPVVNAQSKIRPVTWDAQTSLGFWDKKQII